MREITHRTVRHLTTQGKDKFIIGFWVRVEIGENLNEVVFG